MFTRRHLLNLGLAGVGGLTLPTLLEADEKRKSKYRLAAKADSLICIYLNGGPSHLDMWDMKPNAPAEIRGEFKQIPSTLSSVPVSEHLPNLSKVIHHCSLVRSMHHSVNNSHAAAVYVAMTGHDRGEQGGGFKVTDNPAPGAVASMLRPTETGTIPYVTLPYWTKEGAKGPPQPGFIAGWMGREYDPLWILKDPNAANFSVPEFSLRQGVSAQRLASREQLLNRLGGRAQQANQAAFDAMSRHQSRAYDILASSTTQRAFRIQEENEKVRERYGKNIYGQSVLLARRLIEAGTRVVTVSWAPDANATWDTHGGNFSKLKGSLLPQFDKACSALLSELVERGMLQRTLVAVLGDFGRTPKINKSAGRDHWNYCYSVMLAGGGTPAGMVHGASDRIGAYPNDDPVRPGDLIATIYRLLGIDHEQQLYDRFRRPHQIVKEGDVVANLIA